MRVLQPQRMSRFVHYSPVGEVAGNGIIKRAIIGVPRISEHAISQQELHLPQRRNAECGSLCRAGFSKTDLGMVKEAFAYFRESQSAYSGILLHGEAGG